MDHVWAQRREMLILLRNEAAWVEKACLGQSYLDKILEVHEVPSNWRATGVAWRHAHAQKQPDQRL